MILTLLSEFKLNSYKVPKNILWHFALLFMFVCVRFGVGGACQNQSAFSEPSSKMR